LTSLKAALPSLKAALSSWNTASLITSPPLATSAAPLILREQLAASFIQGIVQAGESLFLGVGNLQFFLNGGLVQEPGGAAVPASRSAKHTAAEAAASATSSSGSLSLNLGVGH